MHVRPRREDRRSGSGDRTSARSRSRRRCSPTARSTSAPRTASFYIIRPRAGRRRDPRSGLAGQRREAGGDRRVAGRRARPRLRGVDGRDLRDRAEDSAGPPGATAGEPSAPPTQPRRAPAALLVTPTELILKPGESIALTVRAFDANGLPRSPAPARRRGRSRTSRARLTAGKFTADAAASRRPAS